MMTPKRDMKPSEVVIDSSAAVLPDAANVTRWIRIGIALLVLGMGGFLLWATTAPLDEGVPVPGTVIVDSQRKTVQHLTGGIIKKIDVRESQLVKAGDVLIELDDTQARAMFESLQQSYFGLRATESRLLAERGGAPSITFHPDLTGPDGAAMARPFMLGQQQLFVTRRAALQGDIGILNESAAGQEAYLKGLTAQLASRRSQLRLLQEQLDGTRDLVKEGYLPRNSQLEQERMAAELNSTLSELQANISRAGNTIAELGLRAAQRKQEFQREVETQLAEVARDAASTAERLVAAREELRRTAIRAPVDGQVVGLVTHTAGGVIGSGQRLMDIVPLGETLVLEAKVPPQLIDSVHAGLKANINFHGFVNQPYMTAEGKVLSISADLVTEVPMPGQPGYPPHYLARVGVTPEGMKNLAGQRLQPGMSADVVINTGERTVLNYLLKPLLGRLAVSMKEH